MWALRAGSRMRAACSGLVSELRLSNVQRRYEHDGFAALNIYKDPQKAPVEKPDSEYPDWLWTLLEPGRTQEELFREADGYYQKGGYDAVFANMDEKDIRRLLKLSNTERIKNNNAMRRGGRVF